MRTVILIAGLFTLTACSHAPVSTAVPTSRSIAAATAAGLCAPANDPSLKAAVVPPVGWKPDPPKVTANHRHQTWLSPTGDTAYGIIYFKMPLPMGLQTALWGFMREMKKAEGEGNLLSQRDDDTLPGIRFEAEGGLYRIRCNLMVDGFHGWVVYAGSLRSRPINQLELNTAQQARDQTRVNLP